MIMIIINNFVQWLANNPVARVWFPSGTLLLFLLLLLLLLCTVPTTLYGISNSPWIGKPVNMISFSRESKKLSFSKASETAVGYGGYFPWGKGAARSLTAI